MNIIIEYFREFAMVFIVMSPWLLFGYFLAGVIALFLSPEDVKKHLGENKKGAVIKAVLLGIPLPLCSCGVIPVATSLRKEGASKGATGAFFVSTPQTGIDSMLVTGSIMGWSFALLRALVAFVTGLVSGLLINLLCKNDKNQKEITTEKTCCCSHEQEATLQKTCCCSHKEEKVTKSSFIESIKYIFYYGFVKMLSASYRSLLIGMLLAALIQYFVPNDMGAKYINNFYLEFLIVIAIAIPLYVCSSASVPIAASLLLKGFSPGAALVFLIIGPATNSVSITSMKSLLGTKATIISLIVISVFAIILGIFMNMANIDFSLINLTQCTKEAIPMWEYATAVILASLIIYIQIKKKK